MFSSIALLNHTGILHTLAIIKTVGFVTFVAQHAGACPGGPRGLGLPPPPLEIEKPKKKRSSEQILSYFTYILLLF